MKIREFTPVSKDNYIRVPALCLLIVIIVLKRLFNKRRVIQIYDIQRPVVLTTLIMRFTVNDFVLSWDTNQTLTVLRGSSFIDFYTFRFCVSLTHRDWKKRFEIGTSNELELFWIEKTNFWSRKLYYTLLEFFSFSFK